MNRLTSFGVIRIAICMLSLGLVTPSFAQEQIFNGIDFVQITGADYEFGSPKEQEGSNYFEKQYTVPMSHTFWLSKYEVTQAQWEAVMGYNPSTHIALGPVATQPVETISWNDVQLFVNQLNIQAGGEYYRLPTEAEWEFVAKANTATRWSFGDSANQLGIYTYTDGNPLPRSIGGRQANPLGIHDLYGNVYEWVEDWYAKDRDPDYEACPPEEGVYKVLRGGSNSSNLKYTRSTSRNFALPDRRSWQIGFRLVRVTNVAEDSYRSGERCKRGVKGTDFFMESMSTNCTTYDHNGLTGDDRGGIAYGNNHLYYTGDNNTLKINTAFNNRTNVNQRDGLLSNLLTEEVYHLGRDGSLVAGNNTTFNQFIKLDENLSPTNTVINLSQAITTGGNNSNGVFPGYGEVIFFFNNTYYAVNFTTGAVESFPGGIDVPQQCENWAYWGFSERIDGIRYVSYARGGTGIVRYDIETGDMSFIASFNNLSDMCSITVSPVAQKWFFHHEGNSQLAAGAEMVGVCDAVSTVRVDPALCGNQELNLGEMCDDGNQVNTDACLNNCRNAVCGDGIIRAGVEDCDDGNQNSDDPDVACRKDCTPQRCGDGIVDNGEECDDGNADDNDGCSNACVSLVQPEGGECQVDADCATNYCNRSTRTCSNLTGIVISALNEQRNGNLGGIAGADSLCRAQAQQHGHNGTWAALLSTTNMNAIDRVPNVVLPDGTSLWDLTVRNIRGQVLYNSWREVFNGNSLSAQNDFFAFDNDEVEEANGYNNDADGWTGSNGNGTTYGGQTCNDWTSTNAIGVATECDARQLFRVETDKNCSTAYAVMCVRVAEDAPPVPNQPGNGNWRIGTWNGNAIYGNKTCASGDYRCQAKSACEQATGATCAWQQYNCSSYANEDGSYYPTTNPLGRSTSTNGSHGLNWTVTSACSHDSNNGSCERGNGGVYGNLCCCDCNNPGSLWNEGNQYCGVGIWDPY